MYTLNPGMRTKVSLYSNPLLPCYWGDGGSPLTLPVTTRNSQKIAQRTTTFWCSVSGISFHPVMNSPQLLCTKPRINICWCCSLSRRKYLKAVSTSADTLFQGQVHVPSTKVSAIPKKGKREMPNFKVIIRPAWYNGFSQAKCIQTTWMITEGQQCCAP